MDSKTRNIPAESRIARLGYYNGEVARGLVHTEEWKQHMREEQDWFDERRRHEMIDQGGEEVSPGVWLVPAPRRRRFWEVLRGL